MLRPSLASVVLAPLAALLVACGGGTADVSPDDYFHVGVEPGPALDDATRALAPHGFSPTSRVDAPRFSAAAFSTPDGRTAVRVTSPRGTVLAMDADSEDGVLVGLDPRTGSDLTGDGHADLIVLRTESARVCHALVEVDGYGALRAMPADVSWLDHRLCVTELSDLDHDLRVEALVVMPLVGLGAPAPSITVPLAIDRRRVFVHGDWPPGFGESEISRRDAFLEVAIDRGDVVGATGLAIELAHIAALRGSTDAEIAAPLARARALALDADATARLAHAEERAVALRDASRPPEPETDPEPELASDPPPSDPTSASASASE